MAESMVNTFVAAPGCRFQPRPGPTEVGFVQNLKERQQSFDDE
jgi:hypothetical protein